MTTSQAQGVLKVFGAWGVAHPDTDLAARTQMAGIAVDGVWGPATALATKNYQGISGLTVDGIIGPNTAISLIADYTGITSGSGPVNS
jgi:peptidoglycan hydrolase-like protein with peptidoglycan-binding domain